MVIHKKLSKMKNKILITSLQGNYGDSLGYSAVVGAESLNLAITG